MIHGAYVIMVVEHISNKEKVILLGAILQGAAQVIIKGSLLLFME